MQEAESEQHPYDPQPKKPLSFQSAVGCAHQESVSTAINECSRRLDHQPSQKSSSVKNEPS